MAEKVDIWMPSHPKGYLASTVHLTCEESGTYLHLLFHSWKAFGHEVQLVPRDAAVAAGIRVSGAKGRIIYTDWSSPFTLDMRLGTTVLSAGWESLHAVAVTNIT